MSLVSNCKDLEEVRGWLYQCQICGLGLRIPYLAEDQLHSIYKSLDLGQWSYSFDTNRAWMSTKKRLISIWHEADSPLLLDVGCFSGQFLKELPSNWQKFGIEASKVAQSVLKDIGIKIISDFLAETPSEWHNRFDVVCIFDVFEHMQDPRQGMISALQYLKPGGHLFVSTGNMNSWAWKWVRSDYWYLETPLHISFATPKFFKWFCKKTPAKLCNIQRISHHVGNFHQKVSDAIASIYFGFRHRDGVFRIFQKAIQSFPAWRYLMHKNAMPSAFYLKDHLLVELQRTVGTFY